MEVVDLPLPLPLPPHSASAHTAEWAGHEMASDQA